ncbi:hypothetical protein Sjap_025382 [Stephania japonica]|uniref:Receptor-like serine/threonine-protein kinase n=1 Tax=Stephania japonica TaxID=461633 RepID=A0AAP0E1Q0_9MAGN
MAASSIALFLLYTFSALHLTSSTDTITHTDSLRDGDTIVSNGGTFALGFFSPANSQKRYVGIWYNKVSEQTVVWVANRANQISISSSALVKIDNRANLVIFNGNQMNPVWSSNVTIPITEKTNSSSLFYKLLDSGNLVLVDENRGGSPVFLWQSFDHPTDTFLAGMKLGLSLKSGANWSLTSPNGEFLSWSGVPEMTRGFIFNYSFVDGPDEIYITYSVYNKSILSRFVLDDLGAVRRWTWVEGSHRWTSFWSAPRDACDEYGQCGPFGMCNSNNNGLICSCLPGFVPKSPRDWYLRDGSQGCVRKREVLCKGGGFLKLEKVKIPDGVNARVDMSLGVKDCEVECRNNCSCTGYAVADVTGEGSGCIAWFGDLVDIRDYTDGGQDLFVRVDAIELENSMRTSKSSFITKKKLVLLIVLLLVGILVLMSVLYYLFKRTKRRDQTRSTLLDWPRRYEIILGIARGVLYLHQDSRLRIIHRDLKASNILLDAEMNPKLSDFGMARIFGSNQTQANTNRVVGTYGYMAPEYAMDGQFSIKSDVFSFGVLLLEIISGKKNNGYFFEDPSMNMIKHTWELWNDGRPLELVDPSLGNSFPEQEVMKCIQVGILCVQENAKDRPTLSSVIVMLGNEATIPPLKQPAFFLTTNPKYSDSSTSGTGSRSINEMSTSIVEGR